MQNWLAKLQPSPWLTQKLFMLAVIVGVGVGAFCWGRRGTADANPGSILDLNKLKGDNLADYGQRVVAYLYNDIPVSRAELGEYLIARFGPERLDFMLNRKIVEMEARKNNIYVTDAEVDARFERDLEGFGGGKMTKDDFVNTVLRRFGKTLLEWKEDVLRPKIMMEKIVAPQVSITEADVLQGFEAKYGPKVECRMIVMEKGSPARQKVWEEARKGKDNFLAEAGKQGIPNLAAAGGKVPPIGKHFGDKTLEDAAFRLKEGDISGLLEMTDGSWVILYCERHLPADASRTIDQERIRIGMEMREMRLAQRIPEVFKAMRAAAMPKNLLGTSGPQQMASAQPQPQPPSVPLEPHAIVPPIQIPPAPVPGAVKGIGLTPVRPNAFLPPPETVTPESKK